VEPLEVSDEILSFDPVTLERRPVRKEEVIEKLRAAGDRRGAAIVRALPEREGFLDPDAVDRRLIAIHCEMQRISEEFQHGQRVAELLRPLLATFRDHRVAGPLRVVDVGCGTGYVLRWLAAFGELGGDVELVGADYHPALVGEADRLAAMEHLPVRFLVGNAFRLAEPGTVFLTSGVIHHFRGPSLREFFVNHERPTTQGFVHFDFLPSFMAPLGSWLFHVIRMRDPLAHHDGVVSAIRAHPQEVLLSASREGAPGFARSILGARLGPLPIPRAFHALVGIRPAFRETLEGRLGARRTRLGGWQ
jgi:SAM-dependent methyltransferase